MAEMSDTEVALWTTAAVVGAIGVICLYIIVQMPDKFKGYSKKVQYAMYGFAGIAVVEIVILIGVAIANSPGGFMLI